MGFAPGSTHRVAGCKQAAPIGKNNHGWMQPPAPAPIHQNPSVSHEKPDLRPWELPGTSPISSHPKSPHAQEELCGGVQSRENQSLKQGGEPKAEAILLNHSPTFPMHLSCAAPAAVLNK